MCLVGSAVRQCAVKRVGHAVLPGSGRLECLLNFKLCKHCLVKHAKLWLQFRFQ